MNSNEKTEKRSLAEDFRLIRRAVGIWNVIIPHFWTYQFLYILANTFSPYFGLYMSAQLVNELAGNCDVNRLLLLAGITVIGEFILYIAKTLLRNRMNLKSYLTWPHYEAYMLDAQNNTQYEHLENPDIVLLRSKIVTVMNANGSGLYDVKQRMYDLLSNILNIIFSVSLTASLFSMTAEGEFSGFLAFINSPLSALLIAAFILADAYFMIRISNTRISKVNEIIGNEGAGYETRVDAFCSLWGTDMIIFGLNRIAMEEFRKYLLRPGWFLKWHGVSQKYNMLSSVVRQLLNIAVFLFTAAKAYIGIIGIGNFVMYQGTISRFIGAVAGLTSHIGCLRNNNRYLLELYEFLDLPNNMYKGTLAVEKRDDIDYEIEFRDVSFRYPRTDTWALRHVNMKFRIGDKLAIVGENGSGKTTFIKLLCRLYDPTEGKILLNGIDITRYRFEEYMALFSVVFQDFTLFGFPLGENVAVNCTYDSEKVRDCLIRAGLGDKLRSLDNDPDAKEKDALKRAIGRDYDNEGIDFSGGEMQKIALARALYKDAPFVILDEPTAALDPIAEAAVYENFNILVKDKTAVFISHRLSSCRFCDNIAVFDHGELVQEGPHDVLVSDKNGKYSQLWHAQAQYYSKNNVS